MFSIPGDGERERERKYNKVQACLGLNWKLLLQIFAHHGAFSISFCFLFLFIFIFYMFSIAGDIYIYIYRERERKYNKVQACLGLKTFTPKFRPLWGFFKACPVQSAWLIPTYIYIYIYVSAPKQMQPWRTIVQELCDSRGGRPGLSVLTSLLVSVDVKLYWTMLRHRSQLVPSMSTDIWGH